MKPESVPGVHSRGTYLRLLGYTLPHWQIFLAAVLGMALYATTEWGFAALMKPMLDESFVARDPESVIRIPLLIVGLFVVRGIAGFLSGYGMAWVGRTVVYTLRAQLFDRLLTLPSGYFDQTPSGDVIARLTYHVEQVAAATTNAVTILIRDSLSALGLLAWMFYLSPSLSLAFLLFGPLVAVIVALVSRRFRRISRRIQGSVGEVTQVIQEAVEGYREIRVFAGEEQERRHFERANRRNRRQQLKMAATGAVSAPLIQLLAACVLAGVVYMASSSPDIVTPGDFISYVTALMLLLPNLKRLINVTAPIQRGIAAAESIFELLDMSPEEERGEVSLERARGRIEYQAVEFAYPAGAPVLRGVSLQLEPGQTVALVGRSGSGKTTLVNLLPRFYEPTAGRILLDGHDITEYRLRDLRRQIAMVSQQVTLFNDTIAGNIAYGALAGASREQIEQAARAAHAWEFIRELPEGLDTPVGENGVLMSGGQRQRIAIARAVLKDAPILILDEATSALDSESERLVQQGLENLMRGRSTMVIAHRLSTVERADCILVLDEGRVVEWGTHQELLAREGLYSTFYRGQLLQEDSPAGGEDEERG